MPTVTLNNGRHFAADPGVSVLDAARAAGVALEYSCRTGRCGACKAPLVSGETAVLRSEESVDSAERDAGIILTCCRMAIDDIVLDVEDLGRLAGIDTVTLPCRIDSIALRTADISHVTLRFPPGKRLAFLAGQYVDVIRGSVRRSYSAANAPRDDDRLELYVKRMAEGAMSRYWFEEAAAGDLLRVEAPFGTFFLRDTAPRHLVFLATGTGIAPVRAMLEELDADPARAREHAASVYWGNRLAADTFALPHFSHIVVRQVLLATRDPRSGLREGYVQEALIADGFDPSDSVVYACGSDAMIHAAKARLLACGLPAARFLSDAFVSSS